MSKMLHLEGIRGLCALLVFYIHFLPKFAPHILDWLTLFQPRFIPVPIFFILSGRVLTASVLRHRKVQSIASSMVKRPIRLVMPIIGIIVLNHVLKKWRLVPFSGRLDGINSWEDVFIHPFHFVLLQGPLKSPLPGVTWTIPLEFQGSLLIYFMTFLYLSYPAERYRPRLVISFFTLFWTCYCSSWLSHFVIGLMIADFSSSEVFLKFKKCKYCWVVATFILGDVAFLTLHGPYTLGKEFDEYLRNFVIDADGNHGVSIVYWKSNLSFLILCTTMMLYVELIPSVQAIFAFRPFVYLGRISFCLYLFHSTFIETIGRYVVGRIGFKTGYQIQWSILASTIIMIIISDILTRIIDDPSVWLANWTERGLIHGDWTIKSQIIQAILSMIYRLWKGLFRFVKGIRARRKQSKFQYNPIPSP